MLSLLKIARAGKASARGGIACPASLLVTCLLQGIHLALHIPVVILVCVKLCGYPGKLCRLPRLYYCLFSNYNDLQLDFLFSSAYGSRNFIVDVLTTVHILYIDNSAHIIYYPRTVNFHRLGTY